MMLGVVRGGVGLHMYQLPHMDFLTVFLKVSDFANGRL